MVTSLISAAALVVTVVVTLWLIGEIVRLARRVAALLRERRADREINEALATANVEQTLRDAGAELRSGCTCEDCEGLWLLALPYLARVTETDRRALAEIGVTWDER